ncbi:MAG: hypothetical protein ABIH34_05430 [Nanoarchaeota archaeon]
MRNATLDGKQVIILEMIDHEGDKAVRTCEFHVQNKATEEAYHAYGVSFSAAEALFQAYEEQCTRNVFSLS